MGISKDAFLEDLIAEAVADIRGCLEGGAQQIDFTEERLSVQLDPSKRLLQQFIDLNNRVLDYFTTEQRQRIGIHTCLGGDLTRPIVRMWITQSCCPASSI